IVLGSGQRRDLEVGRTTTVGEHVPVRLLYVVHDVTNAAALSRQREQLLYNVAHELRGPMSVLDNSLSMIASSYGDLPIAEFDRLVNAGKRTVQRLSLLMENMLSAGSIRAGQFTVRPVPTDLVAVIDQAVEGMQLTLTLSKQRIRCHVPEQSLVVVADPV